MIDDLLATKKFRDLEFTARKTQSSQYDEAKKIIVAKNSSKKKIVSFKKNPIEYCKHTNNISKY